MVLEAQTIDERGIEINGLSATAEISSEDALILLAHDRARYDRNTSLSSGGQTHLQAGDELQIDGRLNAGGDIYLQAEGQIKLTAADIYAGSEAVGIFSGGSIVATAGTDFINEGNLSADGDIVIAARDIVNTRLNSILND